jgi:cation diffusion facilitator CzcD-associated flavoprotein CzcO
MSASTAPRVAVVGAGISGLAHADVLQRCGFEVVVFERAARLGGVWAVAYPEVTLQNIAAHYHLTSFPWPFQPDLHPTGAQIRRYLDEAVAALRLDVRLAHEVVALRPEGEGADAPWSLTVRHEGAERTERFDRVVIAIGQYTEGKHRPSFEGESAFAGAIVTERDVRDLGVFAGKRVAVCGFGKSALDMACLAVQRGAKVRHVFRTPRWTLPRHVLGLHMSRLVFNRFGSVMMPCWAHPTGAERFLHRRLRPLVGGFWSGLQALFRHLALRAARGTGPEGRARVLATLPDHPLLPDLRSAAALEPAGYYRHVATGAIVPHRAEIAGFTRDGLRLGDGSEIAADVVVLSLGSRPPTFPFLPEAARALLEGEPDGPQLYRHVVHPRLPGLGFGGFNHGFMHVPAAEVGALWLAAMWRGELKLPPVEEMERCVEHVRAWKRAHIHFEPSRACAVNTRFQQYLDLMLLDLGLSPWRKLPNVAAEVFARYGAADYRGVVDEYQRRRRDRPLAPRPQPT